MSVLLVLMIVTQMRHVTILSEDSTVHVDLVSMEMGRSALKVMP